MQRTESVEYIKQNLILLIKGIVIKWTVVRISISHVQCLKLYLFLTRQQKYFLPEGAPTYLSYKSFSIILYPDRTTLKYCEPKRETKRGMRSFLKHLCLNSFNFFLPQFKKKLNGKISNQSSFFIFMFFAYSYLIRSVALISFSRGT